MNASEKVPVPNHHSQIYIGPKNPTEHSVDLATREIREVVGSINKFKGGCFCLWGFGFSPIVYDYKIARIQLNESRKVNGVEVYSLCSGSWKKVGFESLPGVSDAYGFQDVAVTANGVMYWLAEVPDMIISFDLAMEVFILIPMPPLDSNYRRSALAVFEHKLAILSLSFPCVRYAFELWVMEEYAGGLSREKCNWTKKYTMCRLGLLMACSSRRLLGGIK
ncbi:F-box/kelch-repeat protein At3g06240-like [Neltuma alba]|uniref:F-box/kelch-repeat protein At3g06240-like n=1 Tax=Neltuma alba TaxID=207710 RepID=UPI0010A32B42|nr:F-box/kelch-repeat protein At3g06240-like [Prosopis alba]